MSDATKENLKSFEERLRKKHSDEKSVLLAAELLLRTDEFLCKNTDGISPDVVAVYDRSKRHFLNRFAPIEDGPLTS